MTYRIQNTGEHYYKQKISLSEGAQIYGHLRNTVVSAGLLDRNYPFYILHTGIDFTGLVICLVFFILLKNVFWLLLLSAGIAFFMVKIGGLVHDAGHRAVFKSNWANDIYGYLLSTFIVFPYYAWKIKHNAHHAHTNQEEGDPDLDIPFEFLEDAPPPEKGLKRLIHKYQVYLYYPIGSLVSISTRLNAFYYYNGRFSYKITGVMVLQAVGLFVYYVLPFLVFPFWKAFIFLVIVNELQGFYLLNIFAPNHKGMPQVGRDVKLSFIEQQIITSRNVLPHWLTDYLYLGLNYQVEHHLFPNCPRPQLRKISPYVKKVCKQYHLPFVEMGVIASTKFIFSELKKASRQVD